MRAFTLERTEVDMHALMTTAAGAFAPFVTLDLTAPSALIPADRYHLETALTNLIDNGIKYARKTPAIVLHTRIENNQFIWSVQDNGIGIAPKYQKAVFRQFFRVPSGHQHDVKGFGLGLYYVRQVVRAHGWHLTLTSELGRGSLFQLKTGSRQTGSRQTGSRQTGSRQTGSRQTGPTFGESVRADRRPERENIPSFALSRFRL